MNKRDSQNMKDYFKKKNSFDSKKVYKNKGLYDILYLRHLAKQIKDWDFADKIRNTLEEQLSIVIDIPNGQRVFLGYTKEHLTTYLAEVKKREKEFEAWVYSHTPKEFREKGMANEAMEQFEKSISHDFHFNECA